MDAPRLAGESGPSATFEATDEAADGLRSSSAANSKENRTDMEEVSHDQNNHYCVCFGPRVIGTGAAACAHSAAAEHDHHRP